MTHILLPAVVIKLWFSKFRKKVHKISSGLLFFWKGWKNVWLYFNNILNVVEPKTRLAEVAREHGWHPPKSLDSDENFKPEHTLFCRELRFVAIYALFFGDLWAKKVPFWVKTVLLGQEVHYYMVYIAYFTELNSKIWDYAQKRRICRENCKYALDERFHGHFCPRRKPAKSCHPVIIVKWL